MKKSHIVGIVLVFAVIFSVFAGVGSAAVNPSSAKITITVFTTPNNAQVTCLGEGGGGLSSKVFTFTANNLPSYGTIYVTADGYVSKTIQVSSGELTALKNRALDVGTAEKTYTVTLERENPPAPSSGYAHVTSNPSGASITVDGSYRGTTPTTITLSTGSHTIRVSKNGYSTYSSYVTIYSGSTSEVYADLSSSSGYISVSSNPSGASIYLDGAYVGYSPLTLTTGSGKHSIMLTKPGYGTFSTSVVVDPGSVSSVSAALPESTRTGYVNIGSNPIGARVYIDEEYVGTTTTGYFSRAYPAGITHNIRFELDGYEPHSESFTTSEGTTVVVNPILSQSESSTASLYVTSTPSGATVTVDGTYYGTTPLTVPGLIAGSHVVKVSAAGYSDNIQTVNLNEGQLVQLPVTLYTPSPGGQSPVPIFGIVAGLAVAGLFCALRRKE